MMLRFGRILRFLENELDSMDSHLSAAKKGEKGERRVAAMLGCLVRLYGGVAYNDLVVTDQNKSTQIDHVYVSPFGIFVFETKHYQGVIVGKDEAKQWAVKLGGQTHRFPSPVMQNQWHILCLGHAIGYEELYNVVIFTEADLNYLTSEHCTDIRHFKRAIATFARQEAPQGQSFIEQMSGRIESSQNITIRGSVIRPPKIA